METQVKAKNLDRKSKRGTIIDNRTTKETKQIDFLGEE